MDRLNASVVGSNNSKCTNDNYYHGGRVAMNKARGPESAGYVTDSSHIRAALIVLIHHSLVKVSSGGGSSGSTAKAGGNKHKHTSGSQYYNYTYTFLHDNARLLPRHPKYVEHVRDIMDDTAAQIVECLLCNGRMRCEDVVQSAWECQSRKSQHNNTFNHDDDDNSDNDKRVHSDICHSFQKLVEAGYVEMVRPIATNNDLDKLAEDDIFGNEVEFGMNDDANVFKDRSKVAKKRAIVSSDTGINAKKQKIEETTSVTSPHHSRIMSLLSTKRKLIPNGSIYRVNTAMFHASLRAEVLSRLVSEIYPDDSEKKMSKSNVKVEQQQQNNNMKYVGAVIKAALTYAARQEHGPVERIRGVEESEEARHIRMAEWGIFSPPDIIPFLPLDITKSLRSQVGGLNHNLSTLLVRISKLQYPISILLEIEEAQGHPLGGKFEVCTRQLLQRMRDRIQHRFLTTHRGLVAARIVSVLQMKGHCESDAIAEDAMVPTKEAREVLHRLHRDSYIDLADMHVTKTHNTGTAIFLWDVIPSRLFKAVINNICTALLNLRLRRQHEVEVGRDWMNRAKDAGTAEENVHESDKKKYHAFCKGLERLDCACLQLDETLMVLKDL